MSSPTNITPDEQDGTFSHPEIFQSIAEFLTHLEARQLDLSTIVAKTMPLRSAHPDFYPDEYQPQLQLTLEAAFVANLEACTELGMLPPQIALAPLPEAERGESLGYYYRKFLQHALDLFKLLEDTAHLLLAQSGYHDQQHPNHADTALVNNLLDNMEDSIHLLSKKLDAAGEPFPNILDSGCYGKWLQHNWAPGVGKPFIVATTISIP